MHAAISDSRSTRAETWDFLHAGQHSTNGAISPAPRMQPGSSVGVALSRNLRLGRIETSEMGLRLPGREYSVKALGLQPGGARKAREESTWVKL